MDRRCAGALLALAACIASTAAAPTANNQTALDLYDAAQQGCYYNFQHYGEGDRIMTNEPCLNCTCHNRMLMCYLRVCPFTKPIGQDCSVEKRADQCCPIVTCPDVPVDLLTSTSTTSPAEYGETGLGKLDRYGCSINGKYFPEGAKVPPTPSKPCEHCYCIRNMTTCVMQECTLHVDGCTPIYHKDVCCPVRYSCDHPEDEIPLLDDMTTTVRPTPGFLLTTTTLSPVTQMTQDCVHDDKVFADGALIKTEKACEHCYCMKGDIVCVVQECGYPMENEGKNCTSMPPREGQCCPDTYICEGDELTTETRPDFTTESSLDEITTLSPPRRVIVEGSGYRKEPGEPFTEEPTFDRDTEGSGEDESFKPIDEDKVDIPKTETTRPLITTENDDDIDQYGSSTSRIPIVDLETIDKTTTEPDKGENTVPSGSVDEHVPEMSIGDKTTTEKIELATESGLTTESYFDAKTTGIQDDESLITDTISTKAEIAPTKATPASETTIGDYQSPTASDDKATAEPTEVTESTSDKHDDNTISEISTPEDKEDELTTKATDFVAADVQTTESAISSVDQEVKTTSSQHLPEQENEVLVKEPTTEPYLEPSTKPDIIKTDIEPATTITPDVTTTGKEHIIETTPVNPVDNEIDEESYPTSSPGRIPGEGDCLLDGITYSNESIVPSNNNCHTSCRCISSIVKCDPIICSAPPEYMDNCQPMYDPPESCCPTYVCDHTKETVPPQSHSQMAGTESPVPTPSVECDGDQCEISKDKEDTIEPTDSSKKPGECGTEGCQGSDKKPDHESHPSTAECVGEKCTPPQVHCAGGICESPITPDQICDSENGCKIPETQACQGDTCKTQSEISPAKDSSGSCEGADGCKDSQDLSPQTHCADDKCESPPTTNQICDSENGCQIPVEQTCQGEDCKALPEVISADTSAPCDNADGCKEGPIPEGHVTEGVPDCKGESCTSRTGTKETADCEDGSDCARPAQSPTAEECKEEGCRRKDVPDINKPATGECIDSNCLSQDNIPQVTNAPEIFTETVPEMTDLPGPDQTIPDEPVTNLHKKPDVEKEIEPKITTEASIFVKDEESQPTTQYDQTDREKESVTDIPEIKTQTPEVQQYTTEINMQKESTITQSEITPAPAEELSTSGPELSDTKTDDRFAGLPGIAESESPQSVTTVTEQPLTDDHTKLSQEDIVIDEQKHDITTSIPTIHDVASEISEDTTAYTEKNYPDVDTNTKVPEYVQEQDGTQTESSTTVSSLDKVKEPDNVTKPVEIDTSAPEETSTEKLNEQPIDQKPHDIVTTPKSYYGETNAPDTLETEGPSGDGLEEQLDAHTATPEKLSTLSQEQQEEKKETDLPGSRVTSDEMVSATEGMVAPGDESETKSPLLPEIAPSEDDSTRVPEITATPEEELYTKTQSPDTIDEFMVTPSEASDKNKVSTEAPMSIVKDKEEDNTKPTEESEISVSVAEQEMTTKRSDLSETSPTESSGSGTEQKETETEETVKDSEKVSSPGAEEHVNIVTEKAVLVDESSSEQPNVETEMPTSDTSTSKPIVTISIDEQPEHQEPSVTEAGAVESASPGEVTSEIGPVTSLSTEIINTKTPESYTEIPMQTLSGDTEITPTKDESDEKEDTITDIPELTVHEHPESISTTEKSEQIEETEDVVTKAPDMSVTKSQDISTQKEEDDIPDLQENITNTPDVFATESLEKATEAPGHESVTPGHQQTEPSEYEPKDVTPYIPEAPATELQKEVTGTPEIAPTEVPEIHSIEPEKVTTEALASQDITTSDSRMSVTEPTRRVSETPETHDIATNVADTDVTETYKDITESPDSLTTIIPVVSEEKPHKESTEAPDSLDITTNTPEISVLDSDKESSESPSSQDATTKVPEVSDAAVTEVQKEASEEPEPQEIVTVVPETVTQKDVSEIPEIATSAPKISVTEALDEASAPTESQEVATKIPEMLTTEAEKDKTEISDDTSTRVPEMSVPQDQEEATEASLAPDVAPNIPESSTSESPVEMTPVPVSQDATTNISETSSSETKMDTTEAPVVQDIATEISSATESQKELTGVPGSQEDATNVPEIPATESQKEVTDAPETQDHDANVPEVSATDSPKEETENPATESQREVTETPVAQDKSTNVPENLATESQKKETESPMAQDVVTSIPEMLVTGFEKEATEAPVDQDAETGIAETPLVETKKDTTEAPVTQDVAIVIPETSATETQKEATQAPVSQDVATSIPETPVTESQKEATGPPVVQDVITSITEMSVSETQKDVTEAPVAQDVTTSIPEVPVTESQKEATEAPVPQDVTRAPGSQEDATNVPEISATETQKEATEAPEVQDLATNKPEILATEIPNDVTESQDEATETPVAQDVATKIPETLATESQKDVTDVQVAQDIATKVPETSATESQKETTDSLVLQEVTTGIPETFATKSQQDVTETSVTQDEANTIPDTSVTESQKELTESPVSRDSVTSISETFATESEQKVTETPVAQDEAINIPETSTTESQKIVTESPVSRDDTTTIPETSATESQKETPVAQDVVENEGTETPVKQVTPETVSTESPKYDTTISPEAELLHEQSTKLPESLVTESQDTVKPTTSLQDTDDDKPKDDEKVHTEMPTVESATPEEHIEPEKSDTSTESPISSESVQPDIKSPEPVTEQQQMEEEDDSVSKTPDQSEAQDQSAKTSEAPGQTSEYPETTPYLVLLEEHTHKKDIYTESPDEGLTTGASDVPTTEISADVVTELAPVTEAELPPKQEGLPTEKAESAHVTKETDFEKATEPSLTEITPSYVTEEIQLTQKPQDQETNEISAAAPGEEQKEADKPLTSSQDEADKLASSPPTEKPHETTAPEEEFILATTRATTIKTEEDLTIPSLVDKYGKPDEALKPATEPETQKPDISDELPKPGVNEVQSTEEAPQPDSDSQFPPSGTSGYGQEPDYGEEDQAFGPGTCRYGGKVYVSAQQIPRDDPCDFCFCFRSDIICLQQSCPPPIHGCHEEPIQGFCCPRYECPVSMATTLNVTTTTTTTTTTLPPHFLPHAYKGAAQRRGCQIKGHTYKVGEVVRASSGPCLHCTCGGDGQMKCDPKVCTPEPMLRQMIAAAVSAKRRR